MSRLCVFTLLLFQFVTLYAESRPDGWLPAPCEHKKYRPDYSLPSHTSLCDRERMGQTFEACVLKEYTIKIHDLIDQNLSEECDQALAQSQQIVLKQGSMPTFQGDPELFRYAVDRRDSQCFTRSILKSLREEIQQCLLKIDTTSCIDAKKFISQHSSNGLLNELKTSMGGFAAAYKKLNKGIADLTHIQKTNLACSSALSEARQCLGSFERAFNNIGDKNIAQHCTHQSVAQDVAEFSNSMNDRNSRFQLFISDVQLYQQNRLEEAKLAQVIGESAQYIATVEKTLGTRQEEQDGKVTFSATQDETHNGELTSTQIDLSLSSRCDFAYKPYGCTDSQDYAGGTSLEKQLADDVGIILPSPITIMPTIPQLTVGFNHEGKLQSQKSTSTTTPHLKENPTGTSPAQNHASQQPKPAFNGFSKTQPEQPNHNIAATTYPSGATNVNGFLYSNDDDEVFPVNSPTAQLETIETDSQLSSVAANTALDLGDSNSKKKKNKRENNNPHKFGELEADTPAGASSASLAGTTQASQGKANVGKSNGASKAMNQGYFNTSSFASAANQKRGVSSIPGKGNKIRNISDGSSSSVDLASLNKKLRNSMRNPANHLEFGSAATNLFQSMCHHYSTYATRNRIRNNKKPGCIDY